MKANPGSFETYSFSKEMRVTKATADVWGYGVEGLETSNFFKQSEFFLYRDDDLLVIVVLVEERTTRQKFLVFQEHRNWRRELIPLERARELFALLTGQTKTDWFNDVNFYHPDDIEG